MKWRIIPLLVTVVIAVFVLFAEAGQKKKGGQAAGAKNKVCGVACDRADNNALEALIIQKRKEFSRDAQKPPDPQHDLEIKQRHGIVIRYLTRSVDFLKLYGLRPMRHL